MVGHTPGPWRIGSNRGYGNLNGIQVIDERHGLCLAVSIGDVPDLEAGANARLIAAAPDMLEALNGLLPIFEAVRYTVGLGKNQMSRIEKARAAIFKAEGK